MYLDKDCFQVIYADGKETAQILDEHRFDLVFFTGSPEIGRLVYQAAAKVNIFHRSANFSFN